MVKLSLLKMAMWILSMEQIRETSRKMVNIPKVTHLNTEALKLIENAQPPVGCSVPDTSSNECA